MSSPRYLNTRRHHFDLASQVLRNLRLALPGLARHALSPPPAAPVRPPWPGPSRSEEPRRQADLFKNFLFHFSLLGMFQLTSLLVIFLAINFVSGAADLNDLTFIIQGRHFSLTSVAASTISKLVSILFEEPIHEHDETRLNCSA